MTCMLMVAFLGMQHVSIASLLVLLLGTLLSTIQQAGEVMAAGINYINPNYTGIMVQGNGRIIMLLAMIVIAPLSLLHELRKVVISPPALQPAWNTSGQLHKHDASPRCRMRTSR